METKAAQIHYLKPEAAAGSGGAPEQGQLPPEQIRDILADGKAENIVVLDISGRSALADYMVIADGRSARHLAALADSAAHMLHSAGAMVKTEGMGSGDWVLIDAGDIIIHLFRPEIRAFYRLEKMWGAGGDLEAVADNAP